MGEGFQLAYLPNVKEREAGGSHDDYIRHLYALHLDREFSVSVNKAISGRVIFGDPCQNLVNIKITISSPALSPPRITPFYGSLFLQ